MQIHLGFIVRSSVLYFSIESYGDGSILNVIIEVDEHQVILTFSSMNALLCV